MKIFLSIVAVSLMLVIFCGCTDKSLSAPSTAWHVTSPVSLKKARQIYLDYLHKNKIERIYEFYCSNEISGNETDGWKIGEWVVTPMNERTLDLTLTVKDYSHYSKDTFIIEFDADGNAKVKEFIPYE